MKKQNKIKVEIANIYGHQELMLDEKETMELIDSNPEHWIFVDNMMVGREHVKAIEFDNVIHIRLMPALVGGAPKPIKKDYSKKLEEAPLGKFEHFRHDGLPGHNASLRWLNEICKTISADVEYHHKNYSNNRAFGLNPSYNEGNQIEISFEGKSGSIYLVNVKFNLHAADALATKVRENQIFSDFFEETEMHDPFSNWGKSSNWGKNSKLIGKSKINKWHIGKAMFKAVELFTFDVHLYSFKKSDWESICIGPRNRVEHDADAVAALLCALENDIESAKIIEMNTLRNTLKENLLTNWIFNVKPSLDWKKTCDAVKELFAVGEGRDLEYGEDEVSGFLTLE